jgi:undecaprenyl-diphosphatase
MNIIRQIDISLFWLINTHHAPWADFFFSAITWLGSGWVIALLLLGIMIWKMPRKFWIRTTLCGAIALSMSGWINSDIKQMVDRPRPLQYFETVSDWSGNNPHCAMPEDQNIPGVHIVGPALRAHSFPSGHTNTAFGSALFLGVLFGGWFWCSFAAAILVAYSRVYLGVHFPLDTVAGALLGMAMSALVISFFVRAKWLSVKPIPLPGVFSFWQKK